MYQLAPILVWLIDDMGWNIFSHRIGICRCSRECDRCLVELESGRLDLVYTTGVVYKVIDMRDPGRTSRGSVDKFMPTSGQSALLRCVVLW